MIIGIDGNEANVVQRVGVSNYAFNLLDYFSKKADPSTQFKVFLKDKPLIDLPKENKFFKYEKIGGFFLWSQIFLPIRLIFKKNIDVFFSPAHYAPRLCPVPYVVTIHDLSYLHYPSEFLKEDLYKLKKWTDYSIKGAKKIIAVSKTTKNDILKNYLVDDKKIEVIYNGYEKALKNKTALRQLKNHELIKPFILYVGTIQPRKNIKTLINAFAKFKKTYYEFELIIAGKKGWLYEQTFNQVEEMGLSDSIFFTDYISNTQLAYLYQNAFCFVLPSFYEGFGIPVLEAMSFSCPTITSFASSLPEVGGDACLYFDPNNSDDLLEKLIMLKRDKELRKDLINKGLQRVKLFSWKNCGEKTLNLIKSL